jgi:hypothetical protein
MIGRALFLLAVTAGTGKILVRDKRIPWPLRFGIGLTTVCLWIPGPFDEMAILLVLGVIALFWRDELREAWSTARARRLAK